MGFWRGFAGAIAGVVVLATVANCSGISPTKVTRVVNGDTIEVEYQGKPRTVVLANVDAPESGTSACGPVECFAGDATTFLSDRLPVGTEVELRFDGAESDTGGRLVAAVWESGKLVNLEAVETGLAIAVPKAGDDEGSLFQQLLEAQKGAAAAGRGMYDATKECSMASVVEQAAVAAAGLGAGVGEDLDAERRKLVPVVLVVEKASRELRDSHWHADVSPDLRGMIDAAETAVTAKKAAIAAKEEAIRKVEAEKKLAAEQAAAAEEAARQKAAADAAAKSAPTKAAAQPAAKKATVTKSTTKKKPTAKKSTAKKSTKNKSNPSGYTGPRCYAPGGKTWRPC